MVIRWIAALVAFVVVAAAGVVLAAGSRTPARPIPVTFAYQAVADVAGAHPGRRAARRPSPCTSSSSGSRPARIASVDGQFTTRTLMLMPIAIALNIILGQTVAAALKIPIYLDSIGTILVGVLAGPLAGAADRRSSPTCCGHT